jgi:hypothetical protein
VITEVYPPPWLQKLHPRFRRIERALYAGRWKLISSTTGKRELYNLAADGAEARNLFVASDATSRRMEQELEDWLLAVPPEKPPPFLLSKEALERLKSLGYVQ